MTKYPQLPALERYRQMEAFHDAWRECNRTLVEQARRLNTPPETLKALRETLAWIGGRYTYTENFHSMIHMLEVVMYNVELGAATGALDDIPSLVRHALVGAYHDLGNGAEPSAPGVDEIAAIETLCEDWNSGKLRSLEPHLTVDDLVRMTASILASVFRDRFASVEELGRQPYISQGATLLRTRLGLPVDTHDLAALARSTEALTLMHADLCGSLTVQSALKYTLANRWEDRHKPGISHLVEPAEYPLGFLRFICGEMHFLVHRDREAQVDSLPESPLLMQSIQCWIALFGDLSSRVIEPLPFEIVRGAELYCAAVNRRCSSIGAPPIDTQSVVEAVETFSAQHGWIPSVFGGLGVVISHFGLVKVQRFESEMMRLVAAYHERLKTFHTLVTKEVPVTELSIGELRTLLSQRDGSGELPTCEQPACDDRRTLMEVPPPEVEHALMGDEGTGSAKFSPGTRRISELDSDRGWLHAMLRTDGSAWGVDIYLAA